MGGRPDSLAASPVSSSGPLDKPIAIAIGLSNGPYRTRTNPAGEAQTKKITQGGTECAPVENKSEQFAQLLQAFNALTPDERSALLEALGGGG